MLSVVRRSRLGAMAAMASVAFLLAVVCPCLSPPARTASGSAHDCCPPEAGIAAAAPSCCAPDTGTPRVSTPVPAGVSLAALTAASVIEAAGLPQPVLAVLASPVPSRAPLILRI
ncbi:MAG TPA: hypothetical protein VFE68_03505 [Vicinamibacteria bacterium]|jgi:hypothetical protein|nr:hypothetical protein [Vicinamibacteria bacterium]